MSAWVSAKAWRRTACFVPFDISQVPKSAYSSYCECDSLCFWKLIVSRAAVRGGYSAGCNLLPAGQDPGAPDPRNRSSASNLAGKRWGSAERRRTDELRGNQKKGVGRLRNDQRKNGANQYRKRACRCRRGYSRVGQSADRARMVNRRSVRMNVDGGDKPGERDQ